ncbi:putative membrane protein [Enterobacter cloacae S611]|uniref:Membrane protein n=1 Tax=Enterobacter cloacae S611 TaxID=1399146 RepID=A0ABN0QCJ3_ENTCL|nr:putative membrane protein [Enterobacter cloacae S611]
MKTRVTLIVIVTLLLILFLCLSHSDLAMETRTFLRALLRAIF